MRAPRILLCAVSCSVLLVAGCTSWHEQERQVTKSLMPVRVEQVEAPPVTGRYRFNVRIYADEDYRAQVLHWREAITAQLSRASAGVEGALGVTFHVVDFRPWQRKGQPGDPLARSLDALVAHDSGDDVDLVVAFVSAHATYSDVPDTLGVAVTFGKHMVLRNMDSPAEMYALRERLRLTSDGDRERLYRERRLHKETALFLHEWAHTMGAFHVRDERYLLAPRYGASQGSFAPRSLEVIVAGLRHHPEGKRTRKGQRAWAEALAPLVEKVPPHEWVGDDRKEVLAWLDAARRARAVLGSGLAEADREAFSIAMRATQEGDHAQAVALLRPVARRYPGDEYVQVLACELALFVAAKDPETQRQCEAAATRFDSHAAPLLALTYLAREREDPAQAAAYVLEARARALAMPQDLLEWGPVADRLASVALITYAEEALERAGPGRERLRDHLAELRRSAVLKRGDPAVSPEREWALVFAELEFERAMARNDRKAVKRIAGEVSKAFPGALLNAQMTCRVQLLDRKFDAARATCRRVIAAFPEATVSHVTLALAELNAGRVAEGLKHLNRAVELDPAQKPAWNLLSLVHRRRNDQAALADLRRRYQAQFSEPMD